MKSSLFSTLKSTVHQLLLVGQWRLLARIGNRPGAKETSAVPGGVLVIPCDPDRIVGSRGDEAMLVACIRRVASAHQRLFIAATPGAARAVAERGGERFHISLRPWMPIRFLLEARKRTIQSAYIMGADMMDGHYSPVVSLRLIIAADLLAKQGVSTSFLGFSYNNRTKSILSYAFRRVDRRVALNLRDPVSFERFQKITRSASLVADTAFLLEPTLTSEAVREAAAWCQRERDRGRTVIAVNIHPLLFDKHERAQRTEVLIREVTRLVSVGVQHLRVSWLLLPHDDREAAGDITTLRELHASVRREAATALEHCFHVETPPSASDAKGLMECVDGALTGRMHLAIATLGSEKPVMVFRYQDKFEGLLRHFELPEWLVLDPRVEGSRDLSTRFERFVRELPSLTRTVKERLPRVILLAESTYARDA